MRSEALPNFDDSVDVPAPGRDGLDGDCVI